MVEPSVTPAAGVRDALAPDTLGADGTVELVRSEERPVVGVDRIELGRLRVGRRIVTEERTVTVTVRREELYYELVPGSGSGAASADASGLVREATLTAGGSATSGHNALELVLRDEETVLTTRVVPRERVRIIVGRDVEEHQVPLELRSEHIDVEPSPELRPTASS